MSLTLVLGFVLGLSLLTFVVLFGRLPALRNTPIGLLHRTLLRTLPNGVLALDRRLCGGRLRTRLKRAADYLMNENHPLVLIFFVSLMAVAELLFLPAAWPDMHPRDKLGGLLAAAAPYLLLRRCIAADPAITRATHARALARYPYVSP
ncbi:palmitoyltransferase swf1 [Ascosphaera acerosa]|nr:palmitoyltransferase swf1 [Ascosphaera acerosa]